MAMAFKPFEIGDRRHGPNLGLPQPFIEGPSCKSLASLSHFIMVKSSSFIFSGF